MGLNIIDFFSDSNNIPKDIGAFYFNSSELLEDGSFQIHYHSPDFINGYFSITLYNKGISVPTGFDSEVLLKEYNECQYVFKLMEEKGYYKNVNLLMDEPYCFSDKIEPECLSSIYTFDKVMQDMTTTSIFSVLFLRGDYEYFHKIRYSIGLTEAESILLKIEEFLSIWLNFVYSLGNNLHIN